MTSASFSNVPDEPECDECARAYQIAQTTVRTCESFLNSFMQVRKDRNAQGTPTDNEQDLLRAMLVFACSGLDSMIKQLIKDALPKVIDQNEGAEVSFRSFIERKISKDQKLNFEVMALSLTSKSPREQTLKRFIDELTQDSLQSKDQVFQITSVFDIPSTTISTTPNDLRDVFLVRNRIIHELDINFSGTNRKRVPRRRDDMVKHVNLIFKTAKTVLAEVDKRCKAQKS